MSDRQGTISNTGTVSSMTPVRTISDEVWNSAVNEWVSNNLANSAMSQSTEAWNHLQGQIPNLRKILEAKLAGG